MSSGDAGQMANENGKYVNVDDAALLMAAEWLVCSEGHGWAAAWNALDGLEDLEVLASAAP